MHVEEGELTNPRYTPTGEHTEQQVLEPIPTGKTETEPTNEISTTPLILSGVALVIVDLIIICDSDPEGTDVVAHIVNETTLEI